MSRVLKICLFVLVFLVGLLFHLRNQQQVIVDYYLGITELSFSASMVLVLALGILLGYLVGLPASFRLKRENARLAKQVSLSEQEINALRVLPMKDEI